MCCSKCVAGPISISFRPRPGRRMVPPMTALLGVLLLFGCGGEPGEEPEYYPEETLDSEPSVPSYAGRVSAPDLEDVRPFGLRRVRAHLPETSVSFRSLPGEDQGAFRALPPEAVAPEVFEAYPSLSEDARALEDHVLVVFFFSEEVQEAHQSQDLDFLYRPPPETTIGFTEDLPYFLVEEPHDRSIPVFYLMDIADPPQSVRRARLIEAPAGWWESLEDEGPFPEEPAESF